MSNVSYYQTRREGGKKPKPIRGYRFFSIAFLLLLIISSVVNAQETGTVVGQLVDAESGDPLIGANVLLESTTIGASTDIDGTFIITNVPVGTYTVMVMYVGYAETKVENVQVTSGESAKVNLAVKPEAIQTEEVVVEAKMLENNEASLLKKRQKSNSISDAISAEAIGRSGSGDAAGAMT